MAPTTPSRIPQPKRGRGRPPKLPATDKSSANKVTKRSHASAAAAARNTRSRNMPSDVDTKDDDIEAESDIEDTKDSTSNFDVMVDTKKRGRPKKQLLNAGEENEATGEENIEDDFSKKRSNVSDTNGSDAETGNDNDDEEVNDNAAKEAVDSPVKQGRGRPPKKKAKMAVTEISPAQAYSSSDQPKKGRGRPRKSHSSATEKKPGRGRGRPRKSDASAEQSENTAPAKSGRGRGRPPKNKTASVEDLVDAEDVDDSSEARLEKHEAHSEEEDSDSNVLHQEGDFEVFDEEADNEMSMATDANDGGIRRRRGHSKKPLDATTDRPTEFKKGHKKPLAVRSSEASTIILEGKDRSFSNSEPAVTEIAGIKKTRGRPPKNITIENTEFEEEPSVLYDDRGSSATPDELPKVVRKRGRPGKAPNPSGYLDAPVPASRLVSAGTGYEADLSSANASDVESKDAGEMNEKNKNMLASLDNLNSPYDEDNRDQQTYLAASALAAMPASGGIIKRTMEGPAFKSVEPQPVTTRSYNTRSSRTPSVSSEQNETSNMNDVDDRSTVQSPLQNSIQPTPSVAEVVNKVYHPRVVTSFYSRVTGSFKR